MIKQVFAPYTEWEDWRNGMYRDVSKADHERLVGLAAMLLSDTDALLDAMNATVNEWRVSAAVNLTDPTKNHRPWLGQAACCYVHQCTEVAVREAWNTLDSRVQAEANNQADIAFDLFKQSVDTNKQLKFRFETCQ